MASGFSWVFVHVKSSNSISFGTEEGKSKYWKRILVGFGKYARSMKIIENHIENPCFSCGLPHDSRLATKCPAPRQGWDIATRQQRRLGDTSFLQSCSSLSFFCSCTYKNGHWWRSTIKPHAVPQSHISTKTHFAATWHIHDPFLHEPGGPAVTWRNPAPQIPCRPLTRLWVFQLRKGYEALASMSGWKWSGTWSLFQKHQLFYIMNKNKKKNNGNKKNTHPSQKKTIAEAGSSLNFSNIDAWVRIYSVSTISMWLHLHLTKFYKLMSSYLETI